MRRLTVDQLRSKCWRLRFFALAAILVTTSGAWLGARREAATMSELLRAGKVPAQLENVPSHNRRYRASLLPSRQEVSEWQLRIENADSEPISGASLVMQAWMPEQARVGESPAHVIAEGNGRYRVEGLRLNRSGWWNVKLRVTQSGITDSLAFNVLMP